MATVQSYLTASKGGWRFQQSWLKFNTGGMTDFGGFGQHWVAYDQHGCLFHLFRGYPASVLVTPAWALCSE